MKKPLSVIAKEFGISFEKAAAEFADKDPDGYSHSEYHVPMYDEDTINETAIENNEMQYFLWYCDNCNAYLNHQFGFRNNDGTWKCEKCGHINYIDKDNLNLCK